MMLHSGVSGAYASRPDGYGRRSTIGGAASPPFYPSQTPLRTTQIQVQAVGGLAYAPSSAFHVPPTGHHVPYGGAYGDAYGSHPPSHHYQATMMHHRHGHQEPYGGHRNRSSPTSVTDATVYDGGLPYDDGMASPPYHQGLQGVPNEHLLHAAPAAAGGYHQVVAEAPVCQPCAEAPASQGQTVHDARPSSLAAAAARSPRPSASPARRVSSNQGPPAVHVPSSLAAAAARNNQTNSSTTAPPFSSPSSQGRPNATHQPDAAAGPSAGDGRQGNDRPQARPPAQASVNAAAAAAGGGGGARGRRRSDSGEAPTAQNLRDNPERLAKVKTEMCHYFEDGGVGACPYGKNCNYAHGKHELRFKYTTLCLMESSGQIANAMTYLSRPCMTWVSTGACPFGRRCPAIHDPTVAAPLDNPSWLPAATANTNAQIIIDRLAFHRDNAIHQDNPLIAQTIWESCRPSQQGRRSGYYNKKKSSSGDQEWADTYALVANCGVSVFTGGKVNSNAESTKLSELQKLSIAYLMRSKDGFAKEGSSELHRDYVFAPTHSLQHELCMILQARYFILLDVNLTSAADVSLEDIVKEVSYEEYKSRTTPWSTAGHPFEPSRCVSAHEVAFNPKGDHAANVSIWFDADTISLVQSQIKRHRRLKQKKKVSIRNEHTRPNGNGALISRTSDADFPSGRPHIDPFVPMLPAEDSEDSHRLMMSIMKHRIDAIILCSSVDDEQKKKKELHLRMKDMEKTFIGMTKFHAKFNVWPKREGMGEVTRFTMAAPGNIMPYIPIKTSKESPCSHNWHTFVEHIGMVNAEADPDCLPTEDESKRLSAFPSFDGSASRSQVDLPRILPDAWWNCGAGSPEKSSGTWIEILHGLPKEGKWSKALSLHNKKKEADTIKGRSTPLSTIPFVQT